MCGDDVLFLWSLEQSVMDACAHIHMHHVRTQMHRHKQRYASTQRCTCTHSHTCARIDTNPHARTYTEMRTHTCTLVVVFLISWSWFKSPDRNTCCETSKICDILASQDYENAMDKCHWPENCEQQGSNQGEILPSHSSLCWFDKWPSRRHTWKWFQIRSSQAGWTR